MSLLLFALDPLIDDLDGLEACTAKPLGTWDPRMANVLWSV